MSPRAARRCCSSLLVAAAFSVAAAGEYDHNFEPGEDMSLWVNRVGPYHNPQETYLYYSLPFCSSKPIDQLEHRWDALGEILEGNDLISSGLAMKFREPVADHTKVCSLTLNEESSAQLQYAVRNHCTRRATARKNEQRARALHTHVPVRAGPCHAGSHATSAAAHSLYAFGLRPLSAAAR